MRVPDFATLSARFRISNFKNEHTVKFDVGGKSTFWFGKKTCNMFSKEKFSRTMVVTILIVYEE